MHKLPAHLTQNDNIESQVTPFVIYSSLNMKSVGWPKLLDTKCFVLSPAGQLC